MNVVVRDGVIAAQFAPRSPPPTLRVDGRTCYLVSGFSAMHTHAFQLSPQLHLPPFVANGGSNVRDKMGCAESRDSLIARAADKCR